MKIERILFVNFSKNSDIDYIAKIIAEGAVCENERKSDYVTTRLSPSESDILNVRRELRDLPASSLSQIKNIFVVMRVALFLFRYDAIMFCSPSIWNLFLSPIVILARKPAYSIIHDVEPHYDGMRGALYELQTRLVSIASKRVFVFSEFSKRRLSLKTKTKITVLPLPTPAELYFNHSARGGKKRYDYIWFGRAERYKGYMYLPDFARRVTARGETLLVVGNFERLEEFVSKLRSLDNVTVVNRYVSNSELVEFVSSARINICPYDSATQSGVVAFCGYIGVPSIVHDVGGLPEQIEEGVTGTVLDITSGDLDFEKVDALKEISPEEVRRRFLATCSEKRVKGIVKGIHYEYR